MATFFSNAKTWYEVLGIIIVLIAAFILLRYGVLQQSAKGWKDLAEQRDEENKQIKAELAELEKSFDGKIANIQNELRQLKADHKKITDENAFLRDQNVELQRERATLLEEKKCISEELKSAREQNLKLHTDLANVSIERDQLNAKVHELTTRLHSMGQQTRE